MAAVVFKFHRSLLQKLVCALVAVPLLCAAEDAAHQKSPEAKPSGGAFDAHAAERFAKLALECVRKEYPNKISHVLNSDADVAPPCKLTPAFCGCYDWHSSVHGHWLLVRLLRTFPDAPFAAAARDAIRGRMRVDCVLRFAPDETISAARFSGVEPLLLRVGINLPTNRGLVDRPIREVPRRVEATMTTRKAVQNLPGLRPEGSWLLP